KNFDYVNPNAPKGGTMKFSAIGTYDTFNPYVVKGLPAAGIGGIFDTLTTASEDEPGSEYGLAAETIDLAPDKLSVVYTLRKGARFHDGSPMTPEDIIWTFNTLREKGHPRYRSYYGDVTKLEKAGERGVRFTLKSADNRELPQIIGQMPVLSKAYWSNRDFTKTTLEPPLGSGAYKIDSFDPGRSVTYRRVADYWGENLRRPIVQDPRVRQALAYGFDFEWSNKNLFYGAYKRTRSYFDNSELAATGVPQGEELKILEPYRGKIPDEVFTKEYDPPKY